MGENCYQGIFLYSGTFFFFFTFFLHQKLLGLLGDDTTHTIDAHDLFTATLLFLQTFFLHEKWLGLLGDYTTHTINAHDIGVGSSQAVSGASDATVEHDRFTAVPLHLLVNLQAARPLLPAHPPHAAQKGLHGRGSGVQEAFACSLVVEDEAAVFEGQAQVVDAGL